MRTLKEIKHDILLQRQEAEPVLRSHFSFCVGSNILTHNVTLEEYTNLMKGKEYVSSPIFGYHLVINS